MTREWDEIEILKHCIHPNFTVHCAITAVVHHQSWRLFNHENPLMLTINKLSIQRGQKVLLDEASVRLEQRQRVGLIGRNGAGKSSLMQVLTGQRQEDGGAWQCDIPAQRVAHLEQCLPQSELSAIEFVKTGDAEWLQVQQQLQLAEANEDGMQIAECYTTLQDIDGYTIDARAGTILHGLGFSDEQINSAVHALSGGWQMRLQLAKVLMARADLLLLDEPTNHLDLEAIAWFEQWLLATPSSVVVISHDRDFLDQICTHIWYLNQQKLQRFEGNYTAYLRQYEEQMRLQSKQREAGLKKQAHMQSYVDRFRAKASKARQAQSRLKAIAKLNIAPSIQQENPFQFGFFESKPLSSPILQMDAAVGYPQKIIFKRVNISLMHQERIGLIGLNGAGKSTLIKTLVDALPVLSGEIIRHPQLKVGYFSQQQLDTLDLENTPLGHMIKHYPQVSEGEARRFLGGFDFRGNRVFDPVERFSGGEKARLALALLIFGRPNILLLDEPTNHLDLQMREALIMALQSYAGAVIVVSHDRYFINSIVDSLWLAKEGVLQTFNGDLNDYQAMVLTQDEPSTSNAITSDIAKPTTPTTAHPRRHVHKDLEKRINQLNKKIDAIETELADPELYTSAAAKRLQRLQQQHQKLAQQRGDAEDEWLSQAD